MVTTCANARRPGWRRAAMRRRRMTEAQDGENIEDWDDLTESERWTMERRAEESAAELLAADQALVQLEAMDPGAAHITRAVCGSKNAANS